MQAATEIRKTKHMQIFLTFMIQIHSCIDLAVIDAKCQSVKLLKKQTWLLPL